MDDLKGKRENEMYLTLGQGHLPKKNIHEEMLIEIQENLVLDEKYVEEHPWTAEVK